MKYYKTLKLSEQQMLRAFQIWNDAVSDSYKIQSFQEFKSRIDGLENTRFILVQTEDKRIIGWLCLFHFNNKVWMTIVIDKTNQNAAIGSILIDMAKFMSNDLNVCVPIFENTSVVIFLQNHKFKIESTNQIIIMGFNGYVATWKKSKFSFKYWLLNPIEN